MDEKLEYEVKYWDNGNKRVERWTNDKGQDHRLNGPAVLRYFENGKVERECWCQNGQDHRLEGPAATWYFEDGEVERKYYCIKDKRLSKEEFESHPLRQKDIKEEVSLPSSFSQVLTLTHDNKEIKIQIDIKIF